MTKPNSTEIVVLLDRSGSMARIKDDMEGAFNTLITQQKLIPGECRVSLFQFDHDFNLVYAGAPLHEVPSLSLIPRGNTALYDALGKAVVLTGERLVRMAEYERPGKVLFVLITDGQENASREYGVRDVRSMVKHQEEKYSWNFIYLGCSASTALDAEAIGIAAHAQYVSSGGGVRGMSAAVSNLVGSYRQAPERVRGVAAMDWMAANLPKNIAEETPPDEKDLIISKDAVVADAAVPPSSSSR